MSEPVNKRSEIALNVNVLNVPNHNLALFSHEADLRVLHECLRYLPVGYKSNAMDSGHVAGSIVTLARLEAFIASTVSLG